MEKVRVVGIMMCGGMCCEIGIMVSLVMIIVIILGMSVSFVIIGDRFRMSCRCWEMK